MSTPQEKIEAQRLAFVDHHNYHLRHMVGPKELERLLEAAAAENPQKLPIMVGASQMTKLWADGIASDVEIATITK